MFEFVGTFFHLFFYQPLVNLIVSFYVFFPGQSLGLAIILTTLFLKIVLFSPTQQALKSQKIMNELQPKIKEIQKKYKEDKQKQAEEMMRLYKEKKFNPFSGFLPLLIQLPIFIALYQIFQSGVGQTHLDLLYSFIPRPQDVHQMFLGIDLSKSNILLALVVGAAQYFQTKTAMPSGAAKPGAEDQAAQFSFMMQKYSLYFFPIMTIMILAALPSGLGLYWLINTVFSIGQNYLVFNKKTA
ncbi:MAG: YidC/Oxa1 family membrane protein insertase [Candidatus Pacebacteria bacterium]|nr:YidC/Oxa1 family membrane protein insertase [Candidatus Paceibacterota bacterium]MDD4830827.1 YidC/Oxa1 family membrane protein insertase [Candidatus Paceibacterota bacterium]